MQSFENEWDRSYDNQQNYLFFPNEEIVRFTSKFIRRKIFFDKFENSKNFTGENVLDLGCGIGRHIAFFHEMKMTPYGIDLSESAIKSARAWVDAISIKNVNDRLRKASVESIPFEDEFFDYAVSHGVLDSMPFNVAKIGVGELFRVMKPGGLFYCDLVSGHNVGCQGFFGEEIVKSSHEKGTIQSYFDLEKINTLFDDSFDILECFLITKKDFLTNLDTSRWHLVLKRKIK